MSKEIAVTGPNGIVGTKLFEVAQAHYPDVKLVPIARNIGYAADMLLRGYDPILITDLATESPTDLQRKLSGVDAVIHLQASSTQRNDWELHRRNIYDATLTLARAAYMTGIPIIPIGSSSQYTNNNERTIDHNTKPDSKMAYGFYKNKALAAAQTLGARTRDYRAIEVVPGAVMGPKTAWADNLSDIAQSPIKSRLFLNTQLAWTDIEDLSYILLQISTNPDAATQSRYIVINGMADTTYLTHAFSEMIGIKPPSIPLPKHLIEPPVRLALRLLGKNAVVSPETFSFGLHGEDFQFVSDAVKKDFGWQPKSIEQNLAETKTQHEFSNNIK